MKIILIIFIFVQVSISQDTSIESGWNGIKIFKSTRQDVEKVLGVAQTKINDA